MRAVAKAVATTAGLLVSVFALASLVLGYVGVGDAVGQCFGWRGLALAGLAFCCEYVDSTLGMGYGTALTPLLMLVLGLEPLVIVPCVLLSELVTGLSAGAAHHVAGNVSFSRSSRATRVAAVLSGCSVLGAGLAVAIALSIPAVWLKLFIGVVVLSMGVIILAAPRAGLGFSWARVTGLGLLAAFNKGMSGGGYGPLVTGGQILSGVQSKSAIGITSVSEGLTCAVGLGIYLATGTAIAWNLAVPLMIGALASVPLSAFTVRRVGARELRTVVGAATAALGLLTLVRLL